ncbi:predicted protein [Chaetoceros tenuissimus]|uniref:Uncharacterized protein n=1 Tax=Chaetoceros tenuissimus TaxID=426638 RepID=A0AAD3D3F6_9STRA|nr:predicted protein [Chaetoceros tenuissimus]
MYAASARNKKGLVKFPASSCKLSTPKKLSPPKIPKKTIQQLLSPYPYDDSMDCALNNLKGGELWNKVAGLSTKSYQKQVVHEIMEVEKETHSVSTNGNVKEITRHLCTCARPAELCKNRGQPITCDQGFTCLHDHGEFDLKGTTSPEFIVKVEKYLLQMVEMDIVMKVVQTRAMTYEETRDYFDELISTIEDGKEDETSKFYGCTFEAKRIKTSFTALYPNADFENGVLKIQRGQIEQMTEAEKAVCDHLRLDFCIGNDDDEEIDDSDSESDGSESEGSSGSDEDEEVHDYDEDDEDDNIMDKVEQLREQRLMERNNVNIYGNIGFILGSAAEVEHYWGLNDVIEADIERQQEQREACVEKKRRSGVVDNKKKNKKKKKRKTEE